LEDQRVLLLEEDEAVEGDEPHVVVAVVNEKSYESSSG
jgi:hypothetical protein